MSIMRIAQIGGIVVAIGGGVGGAVHVTHVVHPAPVTRSRSRAPVDTGHTSSQTGSSRTSGSPRSGVSSVPSASADGSGSSVRLPADPVGGEGAVSSFPYDPGVPVARFTATSPVRPGQTVDFVNESYDTASGVSITSLTWSGRQSSYDTVGVHPVTLVVRDSLGRISTPYTVDVVVSNPPAPPDSPVAYFVVTSPIAAGSAVTYTDESYDPGGEPIVNQIWSGRAAQFSEPGTYPVSLRVVNAQGNWSSPFTRDVVVTTAPSAAGTAAPGSGGTSGTMPTSGGGSYPVPTWSVSATPNPASHGQIVTVMADESPASATIVPILQVPSSLTGSWGSISYASTNASGPMTPTGTGTFERTLTIPASRSFPAGNYVLTVTVPGRSGIPVTLAVTPDEQSPPQMFEEPLVSGG